MEPRIIELTRWIDLPKDKTFWPYDCPLLQAQAKHAANHRGPVLEAYHWRGNWYIEVQSVAMPVTGKGEA